MNKKRWLLFFGVMALAAIAALASSLHDVHFEPGRGLASPSLTSSPILPGNVLSVSQTPLWKIILLWAIFTANLILFFYLLPPELRKRILRQAVRFSLTALILLIAFQNHILQWPSLGGRSANFGNVPAMGLDGGAERSAFHPPEMSSWMSYLISLATMVLLLILARGGYRWWLHAQGRGSSLSRIAEITRSSLGELSSGKDWGDVIIRSYAQMSEAVSSRRGLARPAAMTPREFSQRLEHAGLPVEAVRGLTRLFESARYGARRSSQTEVNEAVACLNTILHACGAAQ
jgi:hypothetical protein